MSDTRCCTLMQGSHEEEGHFFLVSWTAGGRLSGVAKWTAWWRTGSTDGRVQCKNYDPLGRLGEAGGRRLSGDSPERGQCCDRPDKVLHDGKNRNVENNKDPEGEMRWGTRLLIPPSVRVQRANATRRDDGGQSEGEEKGTERFAWK